MRRAGRPKAGRGASRSWRTTSAPRGPTAAGDDPWAARPRVKALKKYPSGRRAWPENGPAAAGTDPPILMNTQRYEARTAEPCPRRPSILPSGMQSVIALDEQARQLTQRGRGFWPAVPGGQEFGGGREPIGDAAGSP